jgi:hypothetical protein
MGRHSPSTGPVHEGATRPSDAEIELKILSRIGSPVTFKYPESDKSLIGKLVDRVVIQGSPSAHGIPYWDVVDLIEFLETPEPMWMRVGYFRFVNGRLVWGSQTTLTEPLSVWKRLFAKAKFRPWFAKLIDSGH